MINDNSPPRVTPRVGELVRVFVDPSQPGKFQKWFFLDYQEPVQESPGSAFAPPAGWTAELVGIDDTQGGQVTCIVKPPSVGSTYQGRAPGCIVHNKPTKIEGGRYSLAHDRWYKAEIIPGAGPGWAQDPAIGRTQRGQVWKYRIEFWETRQGYYGTTGGTDTVKTRADEIRWSDQSPQDLDWFPGKKFKSPSGAAGSAAATPTMGTPGRPKGPYVFNPPLHVDTFTDQKTSPYFADLSEKDAKDRLVTITIPDFLFGTTDAGLYTVPWGFRAHMNPTVWGYGGGIDENVTLSQSIMSKTAPLTPGTFEYRLELMLYRTVDLAYIQQEREKDGTRGPLEARADALVSKWYGPGTWNSSVTYTAPETGKKITGKQNPILEIEKWGTEYDIDFLYRTVNGDPRNNYPKITRGKWTANLSLLTSMRVRVRIGRAEVFEGQIRSIDVQHLMMTKQMVPSITNLGLTIQRWPGFARKDTLGQVTTP